MSKKILYNPSTSGAPEAVEQPIRYGFNQTRGYFTIREWKGTKAGVEAVANSLGTAGWSWEIEGGAVYKLRATLAADDVGGGEETPTTTWQVSANRIEKDFLESNVTSTAPLLTQEEIEDIRAAIDGNNRGLAPTTPDGWEAYLMILQGLRSAAIDQTTVYKVQLVSRNYPIPSAFQTNVGRLYSRSSLISSESIPTVYHGAIPSGASPADSYTGLLVDYPRLRYGFRKYKPEIQDVSFDKVQISQKWEEGLWSRLIYGEPI